MQKTRGDITICKILQGIWFHTQREDGEHASGLWSAQRNRRSHNDAIYKHKSKSSITGVRHRLLWYYSRYAARRYISPIPVYHLPRLRASNVNRFNERKLLYAEQGKKQKITRTNYYRHRASGKYNHAGWVPKHSLEWAAGDIGLHVNAEKAEYMCFDQRSDISTLNGPLKLVDKFTFPRKQRFINREWHQQPNSKGMDIYR